MASKTVNARIEREQDVEVLIVEIIDGENLTEYKVPITFLDTIMTRLNNLHDEVHYILRLTAPASIHRRTKDTLRQEPEADNYTEDSPF